MLAKSRAVDCQVSGINSVEVYDGDNRPHDHRPLDKTRSVEISQFEGLVRGAKRHRLGFNLLDSAARPID